MSSDRREKDHERYLRKREEMKAYNHDYYFNYAKKGLRKPRETLTEEERTIRAKARQKARYQRDREKILAYQREYRQKHKEHLKELRRARDFKRIYLNPDRKPTKTRQERDREFYLRHREEILLKRKQEYERRKQNTTARGDGRAGAANGCDQTIFT